MTVANTPSFAIEEARTRGMDLFEVLVEAWGVINLLISGSKYENVMYPQPGQPGISTALYAIAIGPSSTVDRAWVSWNPQKPMPIAGLVYENITDRVRRISVGSPLLFHNSGVPDVILQPDASTPPDPKAAMGLGILAVFAAAQVLVGHASTPYSFTLQDGVSFSPGQDTTIIPATYFDYLGNSQPFGTNDTTPNIPGTSTSIFVPPVLQLYLYLKPPATPLPAERFPSEFSSGSFVLGAGEVSTEVPIGQIPIYGRKRVRISIRNFDGGAGSQPIIIRAAVIRGINQDPNNVWEVTQEIMTMAAIGSDEIVLDHPEGDYLMLYGTSPNASEAGCAYTVTSYD